MYIFCIILVKYVPYYHMFFDKTVYVKNYDKGITVNLENIKKLLKRKIQNLI